jgi:hypothetical protein
VRHTPALAELERRMAAPQPESPPPGDLTPYELKVFSQNGEDGVLVELLRRTGGIGDGSFVEFGIGAGDEGNCVFLADVLGWSGLFIESDPQLHARLAAKYAGNPRVTTLCETVTPDNLDALLDAHGVPDPDVVSIDVDSVDWWIWHGLARRPRVVVVEYNATRAAGEAVTLPRDHASPWDGTDYFGASLAAFEMLAESKGYRLVHTDLTGVNAFFARDDLCELMPPPERVPRRAANYFLGAVQMPADTSGRPWVEITPDLCRDCS